MHDSYLDQALAQATEDAITSDQGFDAIIVGAGAAGGLAAKLLTESGLNVLVLDAGLRPGFWKAPFRRSYATMVGTLADPVWMERLPMKLITLGRKALKLGGRIRQPVQTKCFAWEMGPENLVDDRQNPYATPQDAPFLWFRAQGLGGKMTVPGHGRQYFRMAEQDLEPSDGLSPKWPISISEMSKWYEVAESHLELTGQIDDTPWAPNSKLSQIREPHPAERELMDTLKQRWPSTQPIIGRGAPPADNLSLAAKTEKLTCRQGAVAHKVEVNQDGRARGVSFFDKRTGKTLTAYAPNVFLCAAALETTRILMLSKSSRHPEGIGADSGALGRNLMDHVVVGCGGVGKGLADEPVEMTPGHCVFVPRFDLRHMDNKASDRGYGVQFYQSSIGKGRSYFNAVSFGEMLPNPDNRVTLNLDKKDAWGIPTLNIECRYSEFELARATDQSLALQAIAKELGVDLHHLDLRPAPPGSAIHECGTARMGDAPNNSVVDPNNECWEAPGVFVTDGAAFPSQGTLNPTLTIQALTARACAHVVAKMQGATRKASAASPSDLVLDA